MRANKLAQNSALSERLSSREVSSSENLIWDSRQESHQAWRSLAIELKACGLKNAGNMAATSSMFMYSLTIQPPSSITQAILGQFAGTKEQQIVTASGSRLTIHRPDPAQGKITTILAQDLFGIIRTLAAFRLAGSNKGMYRICWLLKLHLVILEVRRGSSTGPSSDRNGRAGTR